MSDDELKGLANSDKLLYSQIPEYLDEQSESELEFLNSATSMANKINIMVEMLKYYKNQISFLEHIISEHEMNKLMSKKIDSFLGLSSAAKEFGKFVLDGSEEELLCTNCMEVIKAAINKKSDEIDKPFALYNLEIDRIDSPLLKQSLELDNTNLSVYTKLENEADNIETEDNTKLENEADNIETEDSYDGVNSISTNIDFKTLNELDLELLEVKFSTANLGKYECEFCQATTTSYKKLISHLKNHQGAHIYECERCGKGFRLGHHYRDHILIYQVDRPCICDVCGKGFKTQKYLKRHRVRHITERNIPCPHCDKMFCHQIALQAHCLQCHVEIRTCPKCNAIFKNSVLLKKHLSKAHNGIDTSNDQIDNGMIQSFERFPCAQCEKTFSTKINLTLHYKNIHVKERKHSCPCCSKTFFTSQVMRRHMQCHINENENNEVIDQYSKYKCDECDRTFTVLSVFREHKTLHSGKKEYSCEFCGKMFAFKSYLAKHIRVMHNTTHPKNMICSYCGKVCGNNSALKSHVLTHTGETPFACTICDSKFRYAKSLRLHMKTKHSSEYVW